MSLTGEKLNEDCLALRSQLSDLAQVAVWVEDRSRRFGIPLQTQMSINLCLEEVLANIILHGYRSQPDLPIFVRLSSPQDGFIVVVVEDQAPHFDPLAGPELPSLNSSGDANRVGGQGIRFLRRFADLLEYEATPGGNRLRLGFSIAKSAEPTK